MDYTRDMTGFVLQNHYQIVKTFRTRAHCSWDDALDLAQDFYVYMIKHHTLQGYDAARGHFHSYVFNKIDWMIKDRAKKRDPLRASEEVSEQQESPTFISRDDLDRMQHYVAWIKKTDGTAVVQQLKDMVVGTSVNDNYSYTANQIRRQLLKNYLLLEQYDSTSYAVS